MSSNAIDIKTLCTKRSAPKLPFDFGVKTKQPFSSYALDYLNDFAGAIHGNALNQKMNMIVVGTDCKKQNFLALGNGKTNIFETFVQRLRKYDTTILGRTYKMVRQYGNIMAFMNIITLITKIDKKYRSSASRN